MRRLVMALALLVGVGAPGMARAHAFVVDQRCEPKIWSQYNIESFTPVGQEFTPQLAPLDAAELWITSQNGRGAAQVVVRVRQGDIAGAVLGESAPVTVPDGFDGIAHFDFPAPLTTVPGALHVLEVVRTAGPGVVLLAGDNANSYAGGRPILAGQFATPGDFWFRTGADASLPARASTWGAVKAEYR